MFCLKVFLILFQSCPESCGELIKINQFSHPSGASFLTTLEVGQIYIVGSSETNFLLKI